MEEKTADKQKNTGKRKRKPKNMDYRKIKG